MLVYVLSLGQTDKKSTEKYRFHIPGFKGREI